MKNAIVVLLSIILPAISVGLHFGVFDGIAAGALLYGLNVQGRGMVDVLVKCTNAITSRL